MDVVPGQRLGSYTIGQDLYDVIRTLDCDFKYAQRYNGSVLLAKPYDFMFDEAKALERVNTNGSSKARFHGIGVGTEISQIVAEFPDAAIGVEGDLTLPGHPGIYFLFSKGDTSLLYESGVHDEGISEFVGNIKVKHVVVSQVGDEGEGRAPHTR